MTNRELLQTLPELLDGLGKQRQFLLRVELTPMPCPCCRNGVHALEASDTDLERYDFTTTKVDYRCPHCGAELEQVVAVFNVAVLWHWELKPAWLRRQLDKARRFDEQTGQKPSPPPT
jgi:uncharacterized protein (UPF0212 family)